MCFHCFSAPKPTFTFDSVSWDWWGVSFDHVKEAFSKVRDDPLLQVENAVYALYRAYIYVLTIYMLTIYILHEHEKSYRHTHWFSYSDHSMKFHYIGMLELPVNGCFLQELHSVIFIGPWFQSFHSHLYRLPGRLPQSLVHHPKLTRSQVLQNLLTLK